MSSNTQQKAQHTITIIFQVLEKIFDGGLLFIADDQSFLLLCLQRRLVSGYWQKMFGMSPWK